MSHPFTMPTMPAGLAAKIAADRKMYAGWTMTADDDAAKAQSDTDAAAAKAAADGKAAKPDVDEKLGEPGLKALQAERDARQAAEARAAAAEKQIADSKLTAEQKASADLNEARDVAAMATLKALKYEVAADKGIDINLASRLTGTTKAELEADAESLKALIPAGAKPGTPKPDGSQGAGGGSAKTAGVSAGRDMFRDSRKPQTTS